MARVVAVARSATTTCPAPRSTGSAPRRVQTTRMAFHAIKAGEGDVVRLAPGSSASRATPTFAGAGGRRRRRPEPAVRRGRRPAPRATAADERRLARPARGRPAARRLHRDGPDRGERRDLCAASAAQEQDEFGVRSPEPAPRRRSPTASSTARSPRSPRRTARVVSTRRRPPPRRHAGGGRRPCKPVFRAARHRHRRQLLPAQRRRRRRGDHERHQGRRARPHPAGPDRRHRRVRRCPRRSWASARSRRPGRPWPGPGMTIGDIDLVEINEAFAAQVIPSYRGPRHRPRQAQRPRRRDRARATRSASTGARITTTLLNGLQTARRPVRPRDDVRRRRSGHGDHLRAAQLTAARCRARHRTPEGPSRPLAGVGTGLPCVRSVSSGGDAGPSYDGQARRRRRSASSAARPPASQPGAALASYTTTVSWSITTPGPRSGGTAAPAPAPSAGEPVDQLAHRRQRTQRVVERQLTPPVDHALELELDGLRHRRVRRPGRWSHGQSRIRASRRSISR